MSALVCRCCGSPDIILRGRKPGEFIRREFSFYSCRACELMFVEPFSGFEIYNDAYYRGHGPDPFVDYETEYRDWRASDRGLEFADLARLAATHIAAGAGSREQGAGADESSAAFRGSVAAAAGERRKDKGEGQTTDQSSRSPETRPRSPALPTPSPFSLLPAPAAQSAAWLDFGCGAGGFLKFLREQGTCGGRPLELTGHDVGSYADLLQRVDGFRILNLEQLQAEPDGRFDVISMIEVIEHLPDPAAAIAVVARLLKPGGLLLLTTGNLDCTIARRHGIHYRYCAPEIHVSLFNPRCLEKLYQRFGLAAKIVQYDGAVRFKVVKSLRHRKALRAIARLALAFPPVVRIVDRLYGVSAMPCAVKTS